MNRETNWDWNYWDALPEAGFETCWVQLPGEALVDIQISAEYVARAIQVMNRTSGEKTDVLGHSQGGLVPRWSIKWFPSGTLVGDYIGLASPNHGTETADAGTRFGQAPPAVWQLRRAAKFIAAVNRGDETPGRTHYTSIYTAADELVQPVGTQALAGGTNILLQDICPGRPVDHANIAGDGLTYLLVLDALINPGPAAVKRLPASACQEAAMPGASAPPPDSAPNYDSGRTVDREPRLKPYARR